MRVEVLGCSGGIGAGLHTTAFRVDDDILIDAGTGVGNLSLDEMQDIRHVFLTHAHIDHVVSVPLLVDSIFDRLVGDPLTVHAMPETIESLVRHVFNGVIWPDFRELPDPERGVVRFVEHEPGSRIELDGRAVQSVEVRHSIPAVGYICRAGRGGFCYSGDTSTNDSLWTVLNAEEPVDTLIVEVGFPDREIDLAEHSRHYCPRLLAADLDKLGYRPRILVTHLQPGREDLIMEELAHALPKHRLHRLQGGESFEL